MKENRAGGGGTEQTPMRRGGKNKKPLQICSALIKHTHSSSPRLCLITRLRNVMKKQTKKHKLQKKKTLQECNIKEEKNKKITHFLKIQMDNSLYFKYKAHFTKVQDFP